MTETTEREITSVDDIPETMLDEFSDGKGDDDDDEQR